MPYCQHRVTTLPSSSYPSCPPGLLFHGHSDGGPWCVAFRLFDRTQSDEDRRFGGCGLLFCCIRSSLQVSRLSLNPKFALGRETRRLFAFTRRSLLIYDNLLTVVVSISMKTSFKMNLPPILLTVLGAFSLALSFVCYLTTDY